MMEAAETVTYILSDVHRGKQRRTVLIVTVFALTTTLMFVFQIMDRLDRMKRWAAVTTTTTNGGPIRRDYALANLQSYGFFDDVSAEDWERKRQRVRERVNHNDRVNGPKSKVVFMDQPNAWYQNNWEPDFSCVHERKVGGLGGKARWVCDPHRLVGGTTERPRARQRWNADGRQETGCLVYSIGAPGDLQFEYALKAATMVVDEKTMATTTTTGPGGGASSGRSLRPGCEFHVFGHPEHYEGLPNMEGIHVHPWEMEPSSARTSRRGYLTMQETVEALGHQHRTVDILRVDCEKCEWELYKDWFGSDVGVTFGQILVEVHGSPAVANEFFETFQRNHYVTFHKEPDTMHSGGNWQNYAFLKLAPSFFHQ